MKIFLKVWDWYEIKYCSFKKHNGQKSDEVQQQYKIMVFFIKFLIFQEI